MTQPERTCSQAHGVYEGTYWDLLSNLNELMQALSQMAVGPAVLEEPELQLLPSPALPAWEAFKPVLQPLPPLPQASMPKSVLIMCNSKVDCRLQIGILLCAFHTDTVLHSRPWLQL